MAAAAAAELAVDAGAALTTEPGAGLRKDGRKANELQPLRGELAQLARADGSMQLSHGETTVVAAVYGPRDVGNRKELADRMTIEVTWTSQTGQESVADARYEVMLRQALSAAVLTHVQPRSQVAITVQVVADKGGLLACAINAASMALLDAGVPMHLTVAATACALNAQSPRPLVLDPLAAESLPPATTVTVAYGRAKDAAPIVLAMHADGRCSEHELKAAMEATEAASATVEAFYRKAFERRYAKQGKI